MTDALPEAWELVEHGHLSEEDFRDFMFVNPVRLHADMNPDFFKGAAPQACRPPAETIRQSSFL